MSVPPPVGSAAMVPPNRRWIWPFELMEQIGEGGMGVVYRARYVVNNREVAVKMLPSDVTDKVVLARFERELEVLKSLKHPNIVRCFGGVCEDKGRFYAMELVTGGTLESELQRRGRLPWELVAQYGQQMCAGLEVAHRQGVVHRDVKPSNFLLTADGQLKLSDFGLAAMEAARKITQAGKTAGTFLYMAPEQIRGHEVTPRTDLYALGCVFYELLTGKPPFYGETPAATLHMHLKDTAQRVSQIALDCPPQFEQIVSRLMEKDPADRFGSAEEVSRVLAEINPTITVRSPRKSLAAVSDRPVEIEKLTRAVPTLPPPKGDAGAIPVWITAALGAALAISVMINARMLMHRESSLRWEKSWISALSDSKPDIRVRAAQSLGKSPDISETGVEALVKAVEDPVAQVGVAAATALGDTGHNARPVLTQLMRFRKEAPEELVRIAATESVDRINKAPAPGRLTGWILTILLVATGGVAIYYWYRSVPSFRGAMASPGRR